MPKPRALGAYIFAGGFTLGVREHFDVDTHLEDEKAYGGATATRNLGVAIHRLPDWPLEELGRTVWPFIYGNPPCAVWSHAGVAAGKSKADTWKTDARVDCTRHHFGLLERLRPRVWVWESVSQAFGIGREFVDELAERAMAHGYSVTAWLHDARYLGVPHQRKRFMLICHDVELDLPPPEPWSTETIGRALTRLNDVGEQHPAAAGYDKSYGWLFKDAVGPTNLWATFNKVRGEDAPRNHLGNVIGRPSFLLRRDAPGQVAATLMHERVHPVEDRFMTLRELQHLCGFPSWWDANVKDSHELFRGVMPSVAEHLARHVATAIAADRRVTSPAYRLVDHSRPPGSITPLDLPVSGFVAAARTAAPAAPNRAMPSEAKGAGLELPRMTPTATAAREGVAPPVARVGIPRPKPGVKRMAFLQVCIMMDRWTVAQLVAIVKHHWPDSKVSGADVSTQRRVLVERGYTPPATRRKPSEELPW